jgi:hypothetical protein
MTFSWKTSVWQQYGAAIDMLEDAIRLCPDHLWIAVVWDDTEDVRYGQFWFVAYHSLTSRRTTAVADQRNRGDLSARQLEYLPVR